MHPLKKPAILMLAVFTAFLFISATTDDNSGPDKTTAALHALASHDASTNSFLLFSEMRLNKAGLQLTVFNSALHGLEKLDSAGLLKNDHLVTIIDFSQPSTKKRLYVLDLKNKRLLFKTLVAHGRNSGALWADSFSNDASSLKSSPGFYITGETYIGDNGYSLRLDGMEKDINDNARQREIVMHGARYVAPFTIKQLGFLGRSLGCPALPMAVHTAVINTIKEGTCLFIYTPDKNYIQHSEILNS